MGMWNSRVGSLNTSPRIKDIFCEEGVYQVSMVCIESLPSPHVAVLCSTSEDACIGNQVFKAREVKM